MLSIKIFATPSRWYSIWLIALSAYFKSNDWKYEKKWKLISYGNTEEIAKINMTLSNIYYGDKMDPIKMGKLHIIALSKKRKEIISYTH